MEVAFRTGIDWWRFRAPVKPALRADINHFLPGSPELAYRPDVDGLRAIAVLAVIGFHAHPEGIPGGFIGVDVFFVISGFLISSLIVKRLNEESFSFLEFYARRVRRIFPALAVVLVATLALGAYTLLPTEFLSLGKHTMAAAAFAANVLNYFEAGYFDAPATSKPLLHIWSLGVEEQFYFFFPALLLLIWRYRAMTWSFVLIGIASFALNVALIRDHASFTFFLPLTRFWEFIAGAMFACSNLPNRQTVLPVLSALSAPRWRDYSAAAGMLLIIAGIGVAREASFPGWWALLPVAGSFFIIGAGPQAWLNRHVLAKPGLVLIGLISYPLYLWHWPLLVIGRTVMETAENKYARTVTILAVGSAFLLAWLTYQFIERRARARRPVVAARKVTAALLAGMVVLALLGFVTVEFEGLPTRYPKEIQPLVRDNWNDYLAAYDIDYKLVGRRNTYVPVVEGSRGPLLVSYGDSHAWHLQAGLRRLQAERPFKKVLKGWPIECVPLVSEVARADEEACARLMAVDLADFEQLKPDIVVISAHWFRYKKIDKLVEIVRFLQQIGIRRIVVIGSVPVWLQSSPRLAMYRAYKADPLHRIPERLSSFTPLTLDIDRRLKDIASNLGVRFISAYDVFCNDNGCLTRLGDTAKDIVQWDQTHLTPRASWYFVSRIADRIFD